MLFTGISELVTLEGASKRDTRRPTENDLSVIKNGAMVVRKGRIIWTGPKTKVPRKFKSENTFDCGGRDIVPGFIECHTHSIFSGDRSHEFELRVQGKTYQEIAAAGGGIKGTVQAVRASTPLMLQKTAQKRVTQFLAQGVTTLEIKSGYGLDLKTEIKMLKVAKALKGPRIISTYLGPHAIPDSPTSGKRSCEDYFEEVITNHLPEVHRLKLAQRGDIFIDEGYFTVEEGARYARELKKLGWDLVVHADQLKRTGAARLAIESGAISADHLVCIREEDIRALAKSQTTCVLLPTADFYLKIPYPPARALIDAGARVALATDFNPGSSPTQDLSLVGLLARLEMRMTLAEVLAAYTVGAATALGLQKEIGSLEVGKCADFVILEGGWRDLFYQVGHHPVHSTWVNGSRNNLKSP